MESCEKQDERIKFYFLEEPSSEANDDPFDETQQSDHDESDHVSESEHDTRVMKRISTDMLVLIWTIL